MASPEQVREPRRATHARWAILGLAFAAALVRLQAVNDPDTPWHLTHAPEVLARKAVRYPDFASFTVPGKVFTNHEWLSEVLLYGAYRAAGWGGLVLYAAVFAFASAWLVGRVALRAAAGRPWLAVTVTALVAAATSSRFQPRPHVVGLVGLPLALLFAEDFARADDRAVIRRSAFALGVLGVVWAHCHPSYVLLPALVGLALAGEARRTGLRAQAERLWLPAALALLVFVAPGGLTIGRWVENITTGDATSHIREMIPLRPADLVSTTWSSIWWVDLLLVLALARAWSTRSLRLDDLGGGLLGAALALTSKRFQAEWAVLLAPWAARSVVDEVTSAALALRDRAVALAAGLLVLPMSTRSLRAASPERALGLGLDRDRFPADAADLLADRAPKGLRLLNEYGDGGYLTFRLGPRVLIAIDGRTPNLFDDELYFLVRGALADATPFDHFDHRYHPEAALIAREDGICSTLAASPAWRAVYLDPRRTLFVRADVALALPSLVALSPCAPERSVDAACARDDGRAIEALRAEVAAMSAATPGAPYPHELRAIVELACRGGDKTLAGAEIERALASGTRKFRTRVTAARVALARGAPTEAAAHLDRALALGGNVDVRVLRARARMAADDLDGARDDFAVAVRELDDATPASVRLDYARVLAASGQPERALAHARRAVYTGGGAEAAALVRALTGYK